MIQKILDFCGQNYKFLVAIALAIFEILFLFFRTKKSRSFVFQSVVAQLPDYIIDAESTFTKGQDKIQFVLTKAIDFLESETGCSRSKLLRVYGDLIVKAIETILSTPQKKGI